MINNNKKKIFYILIFFSFFLSISLSNYYINSYDNYQLDQNTHIMLKEETFAHWEHAAKIIKQLKSGTSFFLAGEEVYTKPLPQRIVALYSLITNHNIIDDWTTFKITLGGKLLFLMIQSLIYYFSVFYFYKQISNYFNTNINILIIAFLCLEPTIFQYHSSFWTESFYFSLQLLILSFMLNKTEFKFNYIIIGLLLGILSIQRTAGIFYIFVVLIYFYFTIKKDKFKKILLVVLFYSLILTGLGIHNLKRSEVFYIMPTEGKYSMYKYFAKGVLISSKKFTLKEANQIEVKKSLSWVKKNIPEIDYLNEVEINSPYELGLKIKNEKLRIKYYGYLNKRAYEILFDHPFDAFKKIVNGFIHFSVLNPFFVYYDYEY